MSRLLRIVLVVPCLLVGCALRQSSLQGTDGSMDGSIDAARGDGGMTSPDATTESVGLCGACASTVECSDGNVCASGGGSGTWCLAPCDALDPTCPMGFSCVDDGADGSVCAPLGGTCCVDEDGDAYGVGDDCVGPDCDDTDPDRRPDAVEVCNGIDDDCDERVDIGSTDCLPGTCAEATPAGTYATDGGETCSTEMACVAVMNTPCGLYTCNGVQTGDACATSCAPMATDDDRYCVVAAHCDAGACTDDLPVGSSCDEASDCASGACVDGSCCMPGTAGCNCPGGDTEASCSDGADNDCDTMVDCADPDCASMACGGGRTCMGSVCTCPGGNNESACMDGGDNDCDTLVDCLDPDCANDPCGTNGRICLGSTCGCPGGSTESSCADGVDNDCDGMIDCADPNCAARSCGSNGRVCSGTSCTCPGGSTESICNDGADNDCDGATDCADGNCSGATCGPFGRQCSGTTCGCPGGANETACSDGADNDCDGMVDCADSSCSGLSCGSFGRQCSGGSCSCPGGTTETSCSNGSDDDCDGSTDCADSNCNGMSCGTGGRTCSGGSCVCPGGIEASFAACNDGIDNDCDGTVDCADSSCAGYSCSDGLFCTNTDVCGGGTCAGTPAMSGTFYRTEPSGTITCMGAPANGVCIAEVSYCSESGSPMLITGPPGYCGGTNPSTTAYGCDFNGCGIGGDPHSCQRNFCMDCAGSCMTNCLMGSAD
ncbi:MAG: MopE-related protein [Sandaracinaceae bacterium]